MAGRRETPSQLRARHSQPTLDERRLADVLTARPRGFGSLSTVIRTTVACALSWELARRLGPNEAPVFAPITTMLTVQSSVFVSLAMGVQRVTGAVIGVGLASVYVELVGRHWWTLGLAILISVLAARRLPLAYGGQLQVPFSVLLVVALGPAQHAYGLWRAVDVLVGGGVGLITVLALPQRPRLSPVVQAQQAWLDAIRAQLRAVAADLTQPGHELPPGEVHDFVHSSRKLHTFATKGRDALEVASEAVWLNPRARRSREALADLRARERWLVRLSLQVRTLSWLVDRTYDRPGSPPALPRQTVAILLTELAYVLDLKAEGKDAAGGAAAVVRQALEEAADRLPGGGRTPLPDLLQSVTLLGAIDQLRRDILTDPLALADEEEDDEGPAAERPGR